MAVQKVVTYGHSALRAISKNITEATRNKKAKVFIFLSFSRPTVLLDHAASRLVKIKIIKIYGTK